MAAAIPNHKPLTTDYYLSLPVALYRFHIHALHEVVVLCDFSFGEVQVHLHALFEQFGCLGGVAEEQLAHHAVGGEFIQVTAAEVGELVVVRGLHEFHSFVELRVHGLRAGLEALVFGGHFARFQFLEHLAVGAGVDVRQGCHGLELRSTFVNRSDTGVAVEALASVFEHVAGTAVYLDAVVGVQVGVFGVHALRKRRASRSELLVELELGLLLVGELAGALDVLDALVDVHVAGCLVQECAASVEACAVHEGHHVLDETELAAATEFSLGVLVDKFAGRASVNAELVFDAAHVHAAVF